MSAVVDMLRRIKKSTIGRPTIFDEPMTRVNVMLSEQDLERARKIGNGNVSHRIRLALAKTEEGKNGRIRG